MSNGSKQPEYTEGETIRCIDPGGGQYLSFDSLYTVEKIECNGGEWIVSLKEFKGYYFYADRFIRLPGADSLPAVTVSAPAVNDYVCPSCGNDKCSKREKSCWKCGGTL